MWGLEFRRVLFRFSFLPPWGWRLFALYGGGASPTPTSRKNELTPKNQQNDLVISMSRGRQCRSCRQAEVRPVQKVVGRPGHFRSYLEISRGPRQSRLPCAACTGPSVLAGDV